MHEVNQTKFLFERLLKFQILTEYKNKNECNKGQKQKSKRGDKWKVLWENERVKKKASEELEIFEIFALLILSLNFQEKPWFFVSQAPIQANKVLSDPPKGK